MTRVRFGGSFPRGGKSRLRDREAPLSYLGNVASNGGDAKEEIPVREFSAGRLAEEIVAKILTLLRGDILAPTFSLIFQLVGARPRLDTEGASPKQHPPWTNMKIRSAKIHPTTSFSRTDFKMPS